MYFRYIFLLLLVAILRDTQVIAQDIQLSQFYATPLYLNPAFAGTTPTNRAIFHQRLQWPKLDAKYMTSMVSFDKNFEKYNSGVGILVSRDIQGAGVIASTDVSVLYSYDLQINKTYSFRGGFQLGYVSRAIDYAELTFPTQYDNKGYIGGPNPYNNGGDKVNYADVSSGGLLYSKSFWLAFAAHHLNRPQQSFTGDNTRLPTKVSFGVGYKIPITKVKGQHKKGDEGLSLTPVVHYKFQGESDQLDVGLYTFLDQFLIGSWYRGIPIKHYQKGLQNNESVVLFTGYKLAQFSLCYSYDFTISRLAVANTGGSHEISITFEYPREKTKSKTRRSFPCPRFYEKKG